jgi:hypothetical protein
LCTQVIYRHIDIELYTGVSSVLKSIATESILKRYFNTLMHDSVSTFKVAVPLPPGMVISCVIEDIKKPATNSNYGNPDEEDDRSSATTLGTQAAMTHHGAETTSRYPLTKVTDLRNGSHRIEYMVYSPGMYRISVMMNGAPIDLSTVEGSGNIKYLKIKTV